MDTHHVYLPQWCTYSPRLNEFEAYNDKWYRYHIMFPLGGISSFITTIDEKYSEFILGKTQLHYDGWIYVMESAITQNEIGNANARFEVLILGHVNS